MDLTKYYPDIVAKYPAYVTKRELCEICHICPKTAYNLEQQGEIPYTIEQNHLIRSHKIKLTDILAYRRTYGQVTKAFQSLPIFNCQIPYTVKVGDANSYGMSVMELEQANPASLAYLELAKEVLANA